MPIITVSLGTAKLLKEAGFPQTSELCYPNSFNRVVRFNLANDFGQDSISAPTVDELLAELPYYVIHKNGETGALVMGKHGNVFNVQYKPKGSPVFKEGSFPEAIAQMYLYLHKQGLLDSKGQVGG